MRLLKQNIVKTTITATLITTVAIIFAISYMVVSKCEISTSEYDEIAMLLKNNDYPKATDMTTNEIKTKNKITKLGYKKILNEVSTKNLIQTLANAKAIVPGNICLAKWNGNWTEITIMEITDNYVKFNLGEKYTSTQGWAPKNEIEDCQAKKDDSST